MQAVRPREYMLIRFPGETIPIRLFLGGFDLTPTFREVNKKYSVRYYLSLVLIDEGTSHPHCFSCVLFAVTTCFLQNPDAMERFYTIGI